MTTVIIDVASTATALPHSERSRRSHAANSHTVSALTPPVSSASAVRAMIGAVLAPVLDSGLDTPFGCVDGLRGLVGVSRGNLQTSRVELLLMFLHPGLLDLTELRIADRRTQRGEGERAAVVRRGSTAELIGLVLIAGDRVLPPRVAGVGGGVQLFHFACTSRPLVFS